MTKRYYRIDPENIEPDTILKFTGPLADKSVLEIGCGEGRLTWRYAEKAHKVLGIDPDTDRINRAVEENPHDHVRFEVADIFAYHPSRDFDVVLLSWSL